MAQATAMGTGGGGFGTVDPARLTTGAPSEPESVWSSWSRSVDHWTIRVCFALFSIGVVLAFATSPDLASDLAARRDVEVAPFHFAWRHLALGLPAFACLLILSFLSPRGVRRFGTALAMGALIATALVLVFGVEHGQGARRWFSIAGLSVQPTEFLKPGLVIVCAWLLTGLQQPNQKVALWALIASAGVAAIAIALLVAQPDYGQSALIAACWAGMYFVAGGSLWALLGFGGAAAGVGYAAYSTQSYIADRVDAFLFEGPAPGGQIAAAERAIESGGWFGLGVGEGVRKSTLPDAHADFVIAVAAEEFGFVLVAIIVLLFAGVALRALWRAARLTDPFARLAATGLALLFGLQSAVHIGVSAQILPATGMTLPFISYGGSSLIAAGLTVGLLLAVARPEEPSQD